MSNLIIGMNNEHFKSCHTSGASGASGHLDLVEKYAIPQVDIRTLGIFSP